MTVPSPDMAQATPKSPSERPVVLLCGASELRKPLTERGAVCRSVRGLSQVLRPKEDLHARAIVVGESALDGRSVETVVRELRRAWPLVDVVIWAQRPSVNLVRTALRAGARDVATTSSAQVAAKIVATVLKEQQLLPRAASMGKQHARPSTFAGMVSRSPRMWDLFDTATRVAATEATVLILGETGTGKELLARAIHARSQRPGRFVAVNCGAVQEALIDSELNGHEKGAFTGALTSKPGLFRHAHEGTLMLDEIGNLPLNAQYRLLRALQEGAIRSLGGHAEVPVDVRVIAATSRALDEAVVDGSFREDLFYRLDVIRLELPPLRERKEDIIYLFGHFARECATQYNVARPDVSDDFLDALVTYDWPGNVRQLQNFTERFVLTRTGQRVTGAALQEMLPFQGKRNPSPKPRASSRGSRHAPLDTSLPLERALAPHVESLERAYLEECLRDTDGRVGKAADKAGISRRTLLRKLKHHGIDKQQFRNPS
ncbi:MAG: sigma-54 dependent transcriptional regulator [Polyangiaceae bacterium]